MSIGARKIADDAQIDLPTQAPSKARFLTRDEKIIAIERLRANNMGMETKGEIHFSAHLLGLY